MDPVVQEHLSIREKTQNISESVFVGLCHDIGASSVVSTRRHLMDIFEKFNNQVEMNDYFVEMISGSYKEGFRQVGMDLDLMYWSNKQRVVWDVSQAQYRQSFKLTHFLADCTESPPGFALLQLLTPTTDATVLFACIRLNDKLCISSSLYKQLGFSAYGVGFKEHGPCIGGILIEGKIDYDAAYCFVSDIWPPSASSWKERCQSWPPFHTVNDIVEGGCHFVAKGHKLGKHEADEWRISFSLAEKKLVHSLNHFQFLTLGLLKIFLKEVINNTADENKLLCSYHVKTAVFWAFQKDTIPNLYPHNFLEGFLICFKLILKWVYDGFCPNFFIPENNMFLVNIYGAAQKQLFYRLNAFYEKGLSCLLESSTISLYILHFPFNPSLSPRLNENTLFTEGEIDRQLFCEVCSINAWHKPNLCYCVKALHAIEHLIGLPLKPCQVFMLQKVTVSVLQNIAFIIHSRFRDFISKTFSYNKERRENKLVYAIDKILFHMLKVAARFGCISDMLYIVMYYYKTCRYNQASSVLKMIKVKLAQPCLMINFAPDIERYTKAATGKSWTIKMRDFVVTCVSLYNHNSYISELMIEQYYSLQKHELYLHIPAFVLFHMLEFLCYKHVDTRSSQAAVANLQVIVQQRQRDFINENGIDISWQILGICQQISGNQEAALYAFQQSLTAPTHHKIHRATIIRILILIAKKFYKTL